MAGSSKAIVLEIKEALTNTDIAMAGLTTMTGKQALSSGGMLYFNAASGYHIQIKKALTVLVPSKTYNREMKVFKGDSAANGKINWTNPQPLPEDESTIKLDKGKALFINNCSSCHKVDKDFVAPALHGITDKRSKEWIYAYTRHKIFNEGVTDTTRIVDAPRTALTQVQYKEDHDPKLSLEEELFLYHSCQKRIYRNEMTTNNLSDKEIDSIYTYIKNESDIWPNPAGLEPVDCCDSCVAYYAASLKMEKLSVEREKLIAENDGFFSLKREVALTNQPVPPKTINTGSSTESGSKVTPANNKSVYYTINITAVGWYNIDILMKDCSNCVPSELMVRLQGNYKVDFNVTLIIPSVKAFIEGGKLNNSVDYGFDENDGRIALPQNTKAIILAFAEYEGKIIFGKGIFNTQTKQAIDIAVIETTKENFKAEIKNLGLDNVAAELKDSKNAEQIRQVDKEIKNLEKIKPKNCNCDLLGADAEFRVKQNSQADY